jgi:hypothetical protein
MSKGSDPYRTRFVSLGSVGEAPGVEGSFRRARNHVRHTKIAQHMFQKVSIRFWLNNGWSRWLQDNFGVPCTNPFAGKIPQPLREFDSFIGRRPASNKTVTAKRELWMNAFIAGHLVAIRAWWRQNFQSARNGNASSCCSVAGYLSVPAPKIPRTTTAARTVITATVTDTVATKRKPTIVRIIRFRRRHRACKIARVASASGGL